VERPVERASMYAVFINEAADSETCIYSPPPRVPHSQTPRFSRQRLLLFRRLYDTRTQSPTFSDAPFSRQRTTIGCNITASFYFSYPNKYLCSLLNACANKKPSLLLWKGYNYRLNYLLKNSM